MRLGLREEDGRKSLRKNIYHHEHNVRREMYVMLKILFMRSLKEMRPMLLDTGEETISLNGRNIA